MKQSIVMGIIRAVLASVGGALASAGWLDEGSAKEMAGAVLILIAGIWSAIEKYQAAHKGALNVSPLLVLGFGMMALSMTTGCLSYMGTQSHNSRVERKILQAQVMPDGKGAFLAVNVLELTKGYFGAWSEAPGTMAAATLGDLLTTGGAAYLLLKNSGGGGDDGGGQADIAVTGNGNTTIVTSGDGSTTSYSRSETAGEK